MKYKNSDISLYFFIASILVYCFCVFYKLQDFPIYFFCDEVFHGLTGEQVLTNGGRSASGEWFPVYFEAAWGRWTPVIGVYLHGMAAILFGKTVIVTRAVSALTGVFGAVGICLIFKLIFRFQFWWCGALVLLINPAWFVHTRTGFETTMMSAFYIWTLLFYLLYRYRDPRYLFLSVLFAVLTFYTYSNGHGIIPVFIFLCLLFDACYHLSHWRHCLLAGILGLILLFPTWRFLKGHPGAFTKHLEAVGADGLKDDYFKGKVLTFIANYEMAFSPRYWFSSDNKEIERHRVKGQGHAAKVLFPLVILGAALMVFRARQPAYRAILAATLAVPVTASLAGIAITRVLALLNSWTVLAVIGLEFVLARSQKLSIQLGSAFLVFTFLSYTALKLLFVSLAQGPTWFTEYGLYGMQWGTRQLFEVAIPEILKADRQATVYYTSTWANGAERFPAFFLSREMQRRAIPRSVDELMTTKVNLNPSDYYIMTWDEYQRAKKSAKFKKVIQVKTILYPDGKPGFIFCHLEYADDVDRQLQIDREIAKQIIRESVVIDNQTVEGEHLAVDMGSLSSAFDKDPNTLMRGKEANPFFVRLKFSQPVRYRKIRVNSSMGTFEVFAEVTSTTGAVKKYLAANPERAVVDQAYPINLGDEEQKEILISMRDIYAGNRANIHIREVELIK